MWLRVDFGLLNDFNIISQRHNALLKQWLYDSTLYTLFACRLLCASLQRWVECILAVNSRVNYIIKLCIMFYIICCFVSLLNQRYYMQLNKSLQLLNLIHVDIINPFQLLIVSDRIVINRPVLMDKWEPSCLPINNKNNCRNYFIAYQFLSFYWRFSSNH